MVRSSAKRRGWADDNRLIDFDYIDMYNTIIVEVRYRGNKNYEAGS
jgi:hypothetical protein